MTAPVPPPPRPATPAWQHAAAWLLDDGGFAVLWMALTVVTLMPVWGQRLLPILDAPNHLALVRGWASHDDPAYGLARFYDVRVRPVPYLLFYALVRGLMAFFDIETAFKVFLSLYLVLFPLGVLALARALGRRSWLTLAAFPLALNPSWSYGYTAMLLGDTFALLALAALVTYLRRGGRWPLAALVVATLLCYFSHILPWTLFGLAAGVALVVYLPAAGIRRCLQAAAAMLPSVGVAVAAFLDERRTHAYVQTHTPFRYDWRDFPTLVIELPKRLLDVIPGQRDMLVLATIVVTVAVFAWLSRPARGELAGGGGAAAAAARRPPDEQVLAQRLLAGVLILVGVAYVYVPYQVTGPVIFYQIAQRLPLFGMVMLLCWPRHPPRDTLRNAVLALPMVIAAFYLPVKLSALYRDYDRRMRPFIELVDRVPFGATVMVAKRNLFAVSGEVGESSGDPASSGPVYWHFSSWPMALRGGYSPHLFDQGIPIRYKQRLKAPEWWQGDSFALRSAPEFDYYLISDPQLELLRSPAIEIVERGGGWTLYKRVGPITEEP